MPPPPSRRVLGLVSVSCLSLVHPGFPTPSAQAQIALTYRGAVTLPASTTDQFGTTFTLAGLSGIARLPDGSFAAVMDNSNKLVRLTIAFAPDGAIASATVTGGLSVNRFADWEDIAPGEASRNSVYLASETPEIREYRLSDGVELIDVPRPTIPAVFFNARPNFSLESLSRSPGGSTLWTANEEALTVDGALSTTSAGTRVRLQRFGISLSPGPTYALGPQHAYVTAPIHGSTISGSRSGLSALVALPGAGGGDGGLLALERSLAFNLAGFLQTRIYEVTFPGATDISALPSLSGATFTPATKRLIYSGSLGNVEGLCLGPALPPPAAPGTRVLVGIEDNGDPLSANRLHSWTITGLPPDAPLPCNPADIAGTDAAPGPDGAVNNGDFQLFFASFFSADCPGPCSAPAAPCNPADIAATDGAPGPDGCADNGDFQLFFASFFGGC